MFLAITDMRYLLYLGFAIFLISIYPMVFLFDLNASKQTHTLFELISMQLAVLITILSLMRYYTNKKEKIFLIIGLAFIGISLLDGSHMLMTSTYLEEYCSTLTSSFVEWSWFSSRLLLSIFLFWSYLYCVNKISVNINEKSIYIIVSSLTIAILSFFIFVPLPATYHPELFFHRPEELVPALLFSLTLYGYISKNQKDDLSCDFECYLILSLITSLIAQVVYMLFSGNVFDMEFNIAHMLKILSYMLIVAGLLISMYKLILKERNQQLQIMQESRLTQKSEIISMIAHQWRQPLGAISSITIDLKLKEELEVYPLDNKKSIEEYKKYLADRLGKIETLTQNLTQTIDDFRNFYKPNKISKYSSIDGPVLTAINIIKSYINSDTIVINEDYKSKKKLHLFDGEIMQVILNILKNAEENITIKEIKNAYIKIETEDILHGISLKITDNGGGIELKSLDKIFDPYYSTKYDKNGTGLGLYMSKIIIEEHHYGSLSANNTQDGVCFKIELRENLRKLS